MSDSPALTLWTCARCDVSARFLPGHGRAGRPSTWAEDGGQVYCLACRRELAAEAADVSGESRQRRAQLRAGALADFEVKRDPDRSNGEIAKAIRSSVPAVLKARNRLGIPDPSA